MTTYPTNIHGPSATAPHVTGKVAVCSLCNTQWQVLSDVNTDAKGCKFCGAGIKAIVIHDESETSG